MGKRKKCTTVPCCRLPFRSPRQPIEKLKPDFFSKYSDKGRTKGYKVTIEAKAEFLDSGIATSTVSSNVSPRVHCLHEGLRQRAIRNSYSACIY